MGNSLTYLDSIYLLDQLGDYASPKSKLTTMVQSGQLLRIRRGLYLPGHRTTASPDFSSRVFEKPAAYGIPSVSYSLKTLANKIYGPSYISFEYALAFYGFIPERVSTITSAVYNKNKDKTFETPVGNFQYRYTHPDVYSYGTSWQQEGDDHFLIATREKAICDMLSKARQITNLSELQNLLFADWRIDESSLAGLDFSEIEFLAPLYRKRIFTLFTELLKEMRNA